MDHIFYGLPIEIFIECRCLIINPTTFKETITGQRHPEQLPTSE